jgi:hypothetical protein
VRVCERDDGDHGDRCRPITRKELADDAHANLSGATPPSL